MKLNEIEVTQQIKAWCEQGNNHCPNDIMVSSFVREIIPYLESLENRLDKIERRISTGGRKG